MAQSNQPRDPARGDSSGRTGQQISREDLQRVLQDALYRGGPDDECIGRDDLIALRNVARQLPDDELVLEPNVIELVRAMVRRMLRIEPEHSPEMQVMCRVIAQTLWDDEPTRQRMQRLWEQVKGA